MKREDQIKCAFFDQPMVATTETQSDSEVVNLLPIWLSQYKKDWFWAVIRPIKKRGRQISCNFVQERYGGNQESSDKSHPCFFFFF